MAAILKNAHNSSQGPHIFGSISKIVQYDSMHKCAKFGAFITKCTMCCLWSRGGVVVSPLACHAGHPVVLQRHLSFL